MESQPLACPKCASPNVRRRRAPQALPWFGLFLGSLAVAAVTPYPSPPALIFGMGAWVFLFIAIGVAVYKTLARNRCKDCNHNWR